MGIAIGARKKSMVQQVHLKRRQVWYVVGDTLVESQEEIPHAQWADNITTDHIVPIEHLLVTDRELMRERLFGGLYGFQMRGLGPEKEKILVAGESFGIGSSRENAAEVLRLNGFGYVVAKSFGPIFLDNLVGHGVVPVVQVSRLPQLAKGENFPISELNPNLSQVQADILEQGGLPEYMKTIQQGRQELPQKRLSRRKAVSQTAVEKRLTQLAGEVSGQKGRALVAGEAAVIRADHFTGYDVFWSHVEHLLEEYFEGEIRVERKNLWLFSDHFGASEDEHAKAAVARLQRFWEKNHEIYRGDDGVYMKVLARMLPPESVVIGMDSHTPELGVVPGVLPIPVGYTAFASALATGGLLAYTLPESILVELVGELGELVEIKDAVWNLVEGYFKGALGNGVVFEIGGEGFLKLDYEQAAVIFNSVTEWGGKGAMGIELNPQVVNELKQHGQGFREASQTQLEAMMEKLRPDENAKYREKIKLDLGEVKPVIVGPHTHKQVKYLDQLDQEIKVDRVIVNSCSGAGFRDLVVLAQLLEAGGRNIPVDVHLADPLVRYKAEKTGIMDRLLERGVHVAKEHSCGPCMGQGALVQQGEVVVSTNNRNYPGRMGHQEAEVYLASSLVAAACGVLGRVPAETELAVLNRKRRG